MKTKTLANLAAASLLVGSMSAAHAFGTISLAADNTIVNQGDIVTFTLTIDFSDLPTANDVTLGGGTDFMFSFADYDFIGWSFDGGFSADDMFQRRSPDDCSVGSPDPNCGVGEGANSLGITSADGMQGIHVVGTLQLRAIGLGSAVVDMRESEDAPPSNQGPWECGQYDFSTQPPGFSGYACNPTFVGAKVEIRPVPLPAAAWLMLGGLSSLIGFARRA